MNSSDENINCDSEEQNCVGYLYEPEFTEEELEIAKRRECEHGEHQNEEETNNVCTCGHCEPLQKRRENLCCRNFQHYDEHYITDDNSCICLHADFELICLNRTVLETAYVIFMRYKRMTGRAPDSLTNRQSRLMAYRQFINWVRRGQPLGRKNRVILPACVVVKIRKTFPEESGHYEGFHSESDISSSESEDTE